MNNVLELTASETQSTLMNAGGFNTLIDHLIIKEMSLF